MAFSVSHLSGAEPTLHNLAELERKELAALSKTSAAASKAAKALPLLYESATSVFGSSIGGVVCNEAEVDFMDSYVTKTPKVSVFCDQRMV